MAKPSSPSSQSQSQSQSQEPAGKRESLNEPSPRWSSRRRSAASISAADKRKRIAANARERKRMHLLNAAYNTLRSKLADAQNKSKYDVLVQAKEYIQALAAICDNFDRQNPNHPLLSQFPAYLSKAKAGAQEEPPANSAPSPPLTDSSISVASSPFDSFMKRLAQSPLSPPSDVDSLSTMSPLAQQQPVAFRCQYQLAQDFSDATGRRYLANQQQVAAALSQPALAQHQHQQHISHDLLRQHIYSIANCHHLLQQHVTDSKMMSFKT